MSKKPYGLKIDEDIMEQFKADCKDINKPYGVVLQSLIEKVNKHGLLFLEQSMATLDDVEAKILELQELLGKV